MREREPMTKRMKASQARAEWSQLLNQVFCKETRILVERSGIPVAAIVSADDLEELTRLQAERQRDWQAVKAFGEPFKGETPEESERIAAKAVAEARAQHRRTTQAASQK